jgi:hypothetical protein
MISWNFFATNIAAFTAFGLVACGGEAMTQPPRSLPEPVLLSARVEAPTSAPKKSDATLPLPAAPTPGSEAARSIEGDVATDCADDDSPYCLPPAELAERVCSESPRPRTAFAFFSKAAPFTHLYLRGKFDELAFDEEVIPLGRTAPSATGLVIGGPKYDVLRWDGTCSLGVDADMLTKRRPPKPLAAHFQWSHLEEPVQISLILASPRVKKAYSTWGKTCMGASYAVSPACGKADLALNTAIVDYIRRGGTIGARQPMVVSER